MIGRYPRGFFARWTPVLASLVWLGIGLLQLLRGHDWPWALVFAAAWAALAVFATLTPEVAITEDGIRWSGWRWIAWSDVRDVVRTPGGGLKRWPPELVLADGRRRGLPDLDDAQLEALRALISRRRSAEER